MIIFKNNKIKDFWIWFSTNISLFERTDIDMDNATNFHDDPNTALLLKNLQKIDKKLNIAYSVLNEKSPVRKLVISANGNIKKFSLVKKIVAESPVLNNWNIIAFRPRVKEDDLVINFNSDDAMKVDNMYFDKEIIDDKIKINVYGKGLENYNADSVYEAGMLFMQYALGEYNAIMKVNQFAFYGFNAIYDFEDVKPLSELNGYVETLHDRK